MKYSTLKLAAAWTLLAIIMLFSALSTLGATGSYWKALASVGAVFLIAEVGAFIKELNAEAAEDEAKLTSGQEDRNERW